MKLLQSLHESRVVFEFWVDSQNLGQEILQVVAGIREALQEFLGEMP